MLPSPGRLASGSSTCRTCEVAWLVLPGNVVDSEANITYRDLEAHRVQILQAHAASFSTLCDVLVGSRTRPAEGFVSDFGVEPSFRPPIIPKASRLRVCISSCTIRPGLKGLVFVLDPDEPSEPAPFFGREGAFRRFEGGS